MENETTVEVARLDERIKGLRETIESNRRFQEAATRAAYERMEQRLQEMNNLRAQILEERGSFVSRDLFDNQMAKMSEKMESSAKIQNRMVGGLILLEVVIFMVMKFWGK